jgi:hypothetical protein
MEDFVTITILDMQNIAKNRGGECLSPTYIRDNVKLIWRCKEGHQWEAVPNLIKRGRWCPHCASMQNGSIEKMREMAKERGGRCLSTKYINSQTKLTWQCGEGHQWEAIPSHIKQGHWCPACAGRPVGTIEEMRKLSKSKGGKCLSEEYLNSRTKLAWQCKKGHQWEAVSSNIKLGKWCPVCAGTQTGTIEAMRQIATSRGGRCLSEDYTNSRTKLIWLCKDGHRWKALPSSIKQGHWCSRCARKNR